MKKEYIHPNIKVKVVNAEGEMLAANSFGIGDEETDQPQLSKEAPDLVTPEGGAPAVPASSIWDEE